MYQNPELIFSRGRNQGVNSIAEMVKLQMPKTLGGGNNAYGMTQKMCDAYYMANGDEFSREHFKEEYTSGTRFVTKKEVEAGTYPQIKEGVYKEYADREPRFYASVSFNGCVWALLKNAETTDFVADYPEKKDEAPAESIGEVKEGEIPLLIQWDERWGYIHYGDGIIANSGCGPTALAMVAAGLTGDNSITPYKIASYADANGYYVAGSGSSWSLMTEAALNFRVAGTEIALSESSVTEELNAGHPIICSMKQGDFTTDGHFIVLTGMADGKIQVHDSNSKERSSRTWDYTTLEPQIENLWSFTKL